MIISKCFNFVFSQIYALNKVMTELENENFRKFMEENSAESLPVWQHHIINNFLKHGIIARQGIASSNIISSFDV